MMDTHELQKLQSEIQSEYQKLQSELQNVRRLVCSDSRHESSAGLEVTIDKLIEVLNND